MDWEYYIDNDFSNAVIRSGIFFLAFTFWRTNIVYNLKLKLFY